jgi:hypothetical protein
MLFQKRVPLEKTKRNGCVATENVFREKDRPQYVEKAMQIFSGHFSTIFLAFSIYERPKW